MLVLNKYLREIGYNENSYPFSEKDKVDKEGFKVSEFFSLDTSMTLYLYSQISYFRENIAIKVTPSCFLSPDDTNDSKNIGHKKWLKMIDKILYGLKLNCATEEVQLKLLNKENGIIDSDDYIKIRKSFKKSMTLLTEYWDCFWW